MLSSGSRDKSPCPLPVYALATAALLAWAAARPAYADYFTPNGPGTRVGNVNSASSYNNTEGPFYDGNGGVLYCELSGIHTNDLIWRYDIAANTSAIVVSNSGGTEGAYLKSPGQIVTADRDTRTVSLRSLSSLSSPTALITTFGGKQFNGPNDLVVDSQGGIFFTDPNFEGFSNNQGVDAVYYITPGGTVNQVATYGTTGRPNGIILSPDQKTLYVSEWGNNNIFKYSLNTPGVPTNGSLFASISTPDGMTIDPWGNLIVARNGGITGFSPAGATLFNLTTLTSATNVEIGGADGRTLFYTLGGNSTTLGLYSTTLTEVPEPASLMLLAFPAALLITRRSRKPSA